MWALSNLRPWLILALICTITLLGFATVPLWSQHVWNPAGLRNFVQFTLVCGALAAASIWRTPRWTRAHLVGLALLVGVALVGPGPVAAVAFLAAGCAALGDATIGLLYRLCGAERPDAPLDSEAFAVSTLAGLAIYVTFLALTAPRRIHFLALWALLLALPLVFNRQFAPRLAGFVRSAFAPIATPSRWALVPLAVLGIGLLAHLVLIPKPEAGADGLAMHLALPVRLAANHMFAYDPSAFVWSLMPMAGTFSFAIAYLLGGVAAARLLDFFLLGLVVLLLVKIARRWAPDWAAWLAAGAFVSTPLVQLVTTSVMIENAQTGFLLAALACYLSARPDRPEESGAGTSRDVAVLLAALLAGIAMATKFGSLALALPIVVLAMVAAPRRALLAAAIFLAFALPPYVNAWRVTHNPLFPFMGNVFPSEYMNKSNFVKDMRWRELPSWRTLYDLTFYTSRFCESQNGAFGFQSLLLLPLAFAVPYKRWPWAARTPFWLAVCAGPLVMLSVPHLRYLYPAIAFSTLALPIALARSEGRFRQAAIGCACLAWLLNLAFLPASSAYQKDFFLNPFKADAARVYERNMAPLDELANYISLVQPAAPVALLDCETYQVAYFTGPTFMNNWHSGLGRKYLAKAANEDDILRFARDRGIQWFTGCRANSPEANPDSPAQRFLDRYTTEALAAGSERLARLKPEFYFSQEMLMNRDFSSGLDFWDNTFRATYDPAERAAKVTASRYLYQRVPVLEGRSYRVSIRARCPDAGAVGRLQVNWMDANNRPMPVDIVTVPCVPEWKEYAEVFAAPPGAHFGYFYVTGHNDKPVYIQRTSMLR